MVQHSKALKVSLIAALLIIGLASTPVQAHYNDNLLVPLAGFLVLGSLLRHNHGYGHGYSNHNHGQGYGYSKRRYSHNGYYGYNGSKGHQYHRRARSHSQEGYKRRPKRIHNR